MPTEPDRFRRALAQWTSGVTVVTSRQAERVQGMTVSAFCSVSLEPPLVLVCLEQSCSILEIIDSSKALSVSLLSAEQRALSERFASREQEGQRFATLDCSDGLTGCPRIPGALAWLDCRVVQRAPAGDHTIYVAEVVETEVPGGEPLVYFRGGYHSLPGGD